MLYSLSDCCNNSILFHASLLPTVHASIHPLSINATQRNAPASNVYHTLRWLLSLSFATHHCPIVVFYRFAHLSSKKQFMQFCIQIQHALVATRVARQRARATTTTTATTTTMTWSRRIVLKNSHGSIDIAIARILKQLDEHVTSSMWLCREPVPVEWITCRSETEGGAKDDRS
jgi:hypothetical protein